MKRPPRPGARLWLHVRHAVRGRIERQRPVQAARLETVAYLAALVGLAIDSKGRVG